MEFGKKKNIDNNICMDGGEALDPFFKPNFSIEMSRSGLIISWPLEIRSVEPPNKTPRSSGVEHVLEKG